MKTITIAGSLVATATGLALASSLVLPSAAHSQPEVTPAAPPRGASRATSGPLLA